MFDLATAYTNEFVRGALPDGARRVLEVGCGDGALAAGLQAEGLALVALDEEADCVEAARRRGVDARLASWPIFTDGLFDAVLFTRSLHHVEDLEGGVAAAFAHLAPGGRVIVEDFDFAFAESATLLWLRALLRMLEGAGLSMDDGNFLSALVIDDRSPLDAWHAGHHHDLHGAAAIEAALRAGGAVLKAEPAAYFFRYVARLPAASEALVRPLLAFELDAIRLGHIAPLGRRFVAEAVEA